MIKTVADYENDIQFAQMEISRIQQSCKHDNGYFCGMYSWRIGSGYPTRMCNQCLTTLPGITEEESEKARKDSYIGMTQTNSTEMANSSYTVTVVTGVGEDGKSN
jgi:hypothetical protein